MKLRTSDNNPFVPGSDQIPRVWAGRAAELGDWRDVVLPRRLAGQYERGRVLLGEPGIGKSVLARRIGQEAAAEGHLVIGSIRIPRGGDPLRLVATAIIEAVESRSLGERLAARAGALLDRVKEIRAGITVAVSAHPGPPAHVSLKEALIQLGLMAQEDGRAALLHVDEIQNVRDPDALSQLLVAIGDVLVHSIEVQDAAGNLHERVVPLAVYITGLREFTDRATSAAGATFARRFKPFLLAHLEDVEIRAALAPFTSDGWPVLGDDGPGIVTMTAPAIDAVVGRCLGDPFIFQLIGEAAWSAGAGPVISAEDVVSGWAAVRTAALAHAERIWERVPRLEQQVFESLVALEPEQRTLKAIADRMERTSTALGHSSRRLELRGLIERGPVYRVVARPLEGFVSGVWP